MRQATVLVGSDSTRSKKATKRTLTDNRFRRNHNNHASQSNQLIDQQKK